MCVCVCVIVYVCVCVIAGGCASTNEVALQESQNVVQKKKR